MVDAVAQHIVIGGLMGAGKTTVGLIVADRLGRPLDDSDAWMLATTGRLGREIAATDGVAALHELEATHLLRALLEPVPRVVCAAGSVIDRGDCRAALAGPTVFFAWLRAPTTVLTARAAHGRHRPELAADLGEVLRTQVQEREPVALRLADGVFDVGEAGPIAVAERLLAAMRARIGTLGS
jgi:shikimate kinase